MNSHPLIRPRQLEGPGQEKNRVVLPPRRKVSSACTHCRSKKTKFGHRCEYQNTDKRKTETWKLTIEDLQRKNAQLEAVLETLKCNSFPDAVERLKEIREGVLPSPQHEDVSTSWSDESPNNGVPHRPSPLNILNAGIDALLQPSTPAVVSDRETPLFNLGYLELPPEDITQEALSSYFACGSVMFHVMPREDAESLFKRVYAGSAAATKSDVCLLCAVAAEVFFHRASSLLRQEVVEDDLTGMRVFACLAVYLVLLKSTLARTLTEWTRVLRTLAFTECWLSYTLGYRPNLRPEETKLIEDLAVIESSANPDNEINPGLIRSQVFRIAFLAAQVYDYVHSATHLSMDDLHELSGQLDTWHLELPQSLHLCSLTSADNAASTSIKRPLFFMHMVYITSHITLYERVMHMTLTKSLSASDELVVRQVFRLPADAHQMYGTFAEQLARIIKLIYDEEWVLCRCWLTIHACFHSSLVLLLRATQHLALGAYPTAAIQILSHVRSCLQVLEVCEKYDIAAMRLVDIVAPLSRRVWQTIENSGEMASMYSITDGDDGPKIPVGLAHVVHQLVAAMGIRYQEVWV
ncbi:hypothetical protein BJX61DRAFT_533139 [Aspergillus egyptiacus]|nr:hypothetical protein BJX61DRAFT_533139 [Aspergillus egyptiacus]